METKTYFARSVQAAMEVARRELGPDAMLVTSRPTPEEMQAFGRLEVTFAWEPGAVSSGLAEPRAVETLPGQSGRGKAEARRSEAGLDEIRLEISELRAAFGRQGSTAGAGETPSVASDAQRQSAEADSDAILQLCETGMERATARQIAAAAMKGTGRLQDGGILRELTARIPAATFRPLGPEESRTLAFVGPCGRGKTVSLIKVAARYGLERRIPTRIYSAGAHGVGGAEQMARYCSILGVPFQSFESFESLNLALNGERWKGLVLIDTPGGIGEDRKEMDGMVKFFARRTDIEKHLVIRAEARSADMQFMLTKFAAVEPSRLLFTGVDEARGLGAAAETMIRSRLPTLFFGTGPQMPEDLEEVSVPKLARSLWPAKGLSKKAAA